MICLKTTRKLFKNVIKIELVIKQNKLKTGLKSSFKNE